MKNELNDIEKLFKETFDNYEADVDPEIWENISNQIQQNAPQQQSDKPDASAAQEAAKTASKAGSGLSSTATAIIGVIATAAVVTGGILIFNNLTSEKQPEKNKTELSGNIEENRNTAKDTDKPDLNSGDAETSPDKNQNTQYPASEQTDKLQTDAGNNTEGTVIKKPFGEVSTPSDERYKGSDWNGFDGTKARDEENTATANQQHADGEKESSGAYPDDHETNADDVIIPVADFDFEIIQEKPEIVVEFKNNSNVETVKWDFGDGEVSDENSKEFTHTYEEPGKYTVKMIARNSKGQVAELDREIEAYISRITKLPNIFTPNGDGENDLYKIKGNHIDHFTAGIYDISGNEIYKWNSFEDGWDGTNKLGENMAEGNYFCIVKGEGKDGRKIEKKILIRLSR